MDYNFIVAFLITIVFLIASYIDIKAKEIPDEISYIIAVLAILSLFFTKPNIFFVIVSASVVFLFGYSLYIAGLWGGGDTKLLGALAIYLANFGILGILLYILLMAVSGILYNNLISLFYLPNLVHRKLTNGFLSILLILLILVAIVFRYWIFFIVLILIFDLYYLKIIEKHIMIIRKKTDHLVEGDWLVSDIKGIPKRKIGLTIEDIHHIKKMGLNHVDIKDGFAFIPVMAIAFIMFMIMVYYNLVTFEAFNNFILKYFY